MQEKDIWQTAVLLLRLYGPAALLGGTAPIAERLDNCFLSDIDDWRSILSAVRQLACLHSNRTVH
jgi:hypothetical protein